MVVASPVPLASTICSGYDAQLPVSLSAVRVRVCMGVCLCVCVCAGVCLQKRHLLSLTLANNMYANPIPPFPHGVGPSLPSSRWNRCSSGGRQVAQAVPARLLELSSQLAHPVLTGCGIRSHALRSLCHHTLDRIHVHTVRAKQESLDAANKIMDEEDKAQSLAVR